MENQTTSTKIKHSLPNSTAVLVLGILSIVFCCCCYGIIGLILSIIAIVLANKATKLYLELPEEYTENSFKNMKAGRVCAIIGICISAIFFLIGIGYIIIFGTAAVSALNQDVIQEILNNY